MELCTLTWSSAFCKNTLVLKYTSVYIYFLILSSDGTLLASPMRQNSSHGLTFAEKVDDLHEVKSVKTYRKIYQKHEDSIGPVRLIKRNRENINKYFSSSKSRKYKVATTPLYPKLMPKFSSL